MTSTSDSTPMEAVGATGAIGSAGGAAATPHAMEAFDMNVPISCTGVSPPEHLGRDRGFSYPLQCALGACGEEACGHTVCIGVPEDVVRAREPWDGVLAWIWQLCVKLECNPEDTIIGCLSEEGGLPDNVVLKLDPFEGEGRIRMCRIYAFLPSVCGRHIYPVDFTFIPVNGGQSVLGLLHSVREAAETAAAASP